MAIEDQDLYLDPALRDWVLFPILFVMILVGILRHNITVLLQSAPKKQPLKAIREQLSLQKSAIIRQNGHHISPAAFNARRAYLTQAYTEGKFLKDPEARGKPAANPLTDPGGMDQMINMMKGNMANFIPQTIIMGWVNFFFTGFVLIKLPFPLTVRFKSMLQSGVQTSDLDVRWVSSLSWYFLNLFGLQFVYTLILGANNSANQQMQGMGMPGMGVPAVGPLAPGQDPDKMFAAERENLELVQHDWVLEGVEKRLLAKYAAKK
ncbi:transmembrane protein [Saitoella complicata NRRL Y-17804]|uniref:uncharacterized protein n=1 Tax=Saitoella complicata (strain BCRC 22490 / CBS 7301 / JCM 7358 / NBRC 10748 / NRRL Y-17804) TaxID=698492 RepID=UPI00086711AD|nr:uncharacterized protein SAICODRAFT_35759 [Saitoella complicata NRRL Y-17804]ODQ52359.1 transmembrane protein [Saitoella complicata NRRL Y-17804]